MELIQQVLQISLLPIKTSWSTYRRRPVERPRVRRGVKIRRDSYLLLNVRERRRLEEAGKIWRRTAEDARGRREMLRHWRRRKCRRRRVKWRKTGQQNVEYKRGVNCSADVLVSNHHFNWEMKEHKQKGEKCFQNWIALSISRGRACLSARNYVGKIR
jgi:hypothetical protein